MRRLIFIITIIFFCSTSLYSQVPSATDVKVTEDKTAGHIIEGSYTFNPDINGDLEGTSTFKWYRADDATGTSETEVPGAIEQKYTILNGDVGKFFAFEVTPIDDQNHIGTPVKSGYYGPIVNNPPTVAISGFSGTAKIGNTITVLYSESDSENDPITLSFQWARSATSGGPYSDITSETNASYTLTSSDIGQYLRITITPTASSGATPGTPVSLEIPVENSEPVANITGYTGTPKIGNIIAVQYTVTDIDGDLTGATFQWARSATSGSPYTDIDAATSDSYTLTSLDINQFLRITVTPTASSGATPGTPASLEIPVENSEPIANITGYTGTPKIGNIIVVQYTVTDIDGDLTGATFQWARSATSGGPYSDIDAATSASYTLTNLDINQFLRITVTPTASSGVTPGTPASLEILVENSEPVANITGYTGTPKIGNTITAQYTVTDADADPTGSTLQWARSSTSGGTYTDIPSATNASYTLTSSDIGQYLRITVTPTATSGVTPGTAVSSVIPVENSAPVATISSISGTRQIGQTLTVNFSVSDVDNDATGSDIQWWRSSTIDGTYDLITGANSDTYTITLSDKDQFLKAEVTPTATAGVSPGTPVNSIVQVENTAPVATITGISGTPNVFETLTVNYTIDDLESDPRSGNIQWYRYNTGTGLYDAISGATLATYTITLADKDQLLKVEVTPVAASGATPGTKVSETAQVQNTVPLAVSTGITGTPNVQQVLTANFTISDLELDPTSADIQWYRAASSSGPFSLISGANSNTYTTVLADKEQYLKVEITPTASSGASPGAMVSAGIQIVNAPPVASNLVLSGTAIYNNSIQTTFTYSDVDEDNQGVTTYKWYISPTKSGGYTQITGANLSSYIIKSEDVSKYIYCEVTPTALSGVIQGQAKNTDTVYIKNQAPVASALYITGNLEYGSILRGKYTYSDLENNAEGVSVYKWYRANSASGSGKTLIPGANLDTYVVQLADMNLYLSFEVTPVASSGTLIGDTKESSFVGPVLNTSPKATNIQVIGTQAVCKVLTGQYTYYDIEGDPEGFTTFRWLRASTYNGTKTAITGADKITYTLTTDDQGKYIFFEVTPRATNGEINGAPTLSNGTGAILNLLPTVTFSGGTSICQGQITYLALTFSGSPPFILNYTNGTDHYSLSTASYFYNLPITAGGTYKADSLKDNLGCTVTSLPSQTTVTINPLPTVNIIGLNDAYSLYGSPVPLVGSPTGGVFSGPGVVPSTNMFYPNIAGVANSPHSIVYTYTDPSTGCTNAVTKIVSVLDVNALISGIRDEAKYCTYDPAFLITGVNNKNVIGSFTISGGLGLTDHGDNTATINPLLLSAGQYTITYSYLDNVIQTITKVITIEQLEKARILNIPALVHCQNAASVKLTGNYAAGIFSGSGIMQLGNDYYFNPPYAKVGNDKVMYSYTTSYGCKLSDSVTFTIRSLPRVQFEVENKCWNGDSTVFINLSEPLDSITSWAWNFGDNTVSETMNKSTKYEPKHLYSSVGDKNISLVASNILGCKDTMSRVMHLGDIPKVDFSWNRECFVPNQSISFTNQSTGNDPVSDYLWTINDTSANPIYLNTQNISLTFPRESGYNVKLKITNTSNCVDSTQKAIYLRPIHSVKDSVYDNSLETNSKKWYTSINAGANWIWENPGGSVINGAHSGNKAYYTEIPVNRTDQVIDISSQCFDFTGVHRPFIEMWINTNTETGKEGAVLQYSWDDSVKWETIGNVGTGVNWYNDNAITALPSSPRSGWSGNTNGWIQVRHNLDSLKGQKNVKFRIRYGVNASSLYKEGFAFDDVFIGQRAKSVLFEHFTNESDASSQAANDELYKVLKLAGIDAYSIQYHTSFPGADTLNARNQQDPATRVLYYGVGIVPECILDGGPETRYVYDFNTNTPNINDVNIRALKDPDFDLDISAEYKVPNITGNIQVKALKNISGRNISLYIAVVEDAEIQKGSVKSTYYNVLKKFLPTASGTQLKANWIANETETVDFSWISQYIYNSNNVKIIAYIQDEQTREIYQVNLLKTTPLVSIRPVPIIGEQLIGSFYPNPVVTTGTLVFNKALAKDLTMRLVDKNGKILHEIKLQRGIGEFVYDFSDYANGVYFIQISGNNTPPETIRVMVMH